jgi:uncharacterized protein YkwD
MPRRYRTVVIAAIIAVVMVVGTSTQAAGSCYWHSKKDRLLAKKTNASRANAGVGKLKLDPQLSRVAKRQAKAMARKRTLYHTPNLGSLVTRWRSVGENVGYASGVKRVHKMFMGSSGHRSNIMKSSYRHMGTGAIRAGGNVWVAVVFESRRNPGTTLKMPKC